MRELAELTWEEVGRLDLARTIAILPVGATEAHGPHLPLATDVLIAEAMAGAGAERLDDEAVRGLVLPPLVYTAAPFAASFVGTLSMSAGTVTAQVEALASELARHGFAGLAIANAHLDPAHLKSLHDAVSAVRARDEIAIAFPDLTRKPWALRLTEEFKSGACHAGRFETSIVMAVRPDLVRDAVRTALPPNPSSLATAIRAGKASFAEAGGDRAYFGWPAEASVEEGRATIGVLGGILAEAALEALNTRGATS